MAREVGFVLFVCVALFGCTKTVDDWMTDIDAAYAKVQECESESTVSDNCANAYVAVREHEVKQNQLEIAKAQAEKLAEKKAEEEAFERDYNIASTEFKKMDYRDFVDLRCKTSPECKAYRDIEETKRMQFLNEFRKRFSWLDVDSSVFRDEYCQGLSMDEFICQMGPKLSEHYAAQALDRMMSIQSGYDADRNVLKKDYNECVDRLNSIKWPADNYGRIYATTWVLEQIKKGDYSWERCNAAWKYAFHILKMSVSTEMKEKL